MSTRSLRLRADANVPGVEPKADQTASLSPGGPLGTSSHASPGPRLGYDFSRVGVSSRTVAGYAPATACSGRSWRSAGLTMNTSWTRTGSPNR